MGLIQRYVRAVGSGNLKNDALHGDTDVLAAMALSSHFGGLLARVKYFNDHASYYRLLEQWTVIVAAKAARRSWPEHVPVGKVAYLSLTRWISCLCPACTGVGKLKVFNAPLRADQDCPVCNGSGETELRCDPRLRDYILDMVEELTMDEHRAAERARRKLQSARDALAPELA